MSLHKRLSHASRASGFSLLYLFVDSYSDFWISILAKRPANGAQFLAAIQKVRLFYLKYGHVIRKLHFDAGKIENYVLVLDHLSANSILTDSAAPGALYQNPVERHIQTLVKKTTTVLIDQKNLDSTFLSLAARTVE